MDSTTMIFGVVFLVGGVSSGDGTSSPDVSSREEPQIENCPSTVPSSETTIRDAENGVVVTVTSPDPAARGEVRRRAHAQETVATQSRPGDVESLTSASARDSFPSCLATTRTARVAVEDLPDGARLTVQTPSKSEGQSLQRMTRRRLRQLSARR